MFGVVALIAWPMAKDSIWRLFLIAAVPAIPETIRAVWQIPTIRLYAHRFWARVSGPTYEVQAGGVIRSTSLEDEKELLDLGLSTAKKVYASAKVETRLTNRLVIKAGQSRTIRVDLPQGFDQDDEHMGSDEEQCNDREIAFQMWGYDGKATRIEYLLAKEIAPFFDNVIAAMKAKNDSRNFWLTISMEGKNPFLKYYLRDVPNAEVDKFQLDLTDVLAGDSVKVAIREDSFRFAANNPWGLVNSARTYLSTPALAHRDSD